MKRVCVFAHWDKDNIIDDYVVYYLKALKEVADTIIFVSDCDLKTDETSKLYGIADYIVAEKHGEYDFGSYKRGFLLAKEKRLEFDELIFANDSVYGPFYSLKQIFDKMDKKKCDWWGLTQNTFCIKKRDNNYTLDYYPHIQSYFLIFKKQIFENNSFINFIHSIEKQQTKEDVVFKYERGLNELLKTNRFIGTVYIDKYHFIENCTLAKWNKLITKYHFPFLKTAIPKRGLQFIGKIKNWDTVIKKVSNYPISLIKQNSERYTDYHEEKHGYERIRYELLKNLPFFARILVIKIEKFSFKILKTLFFNKL